MFDWFSTCPVDPVARDWIDCRWRWLIDEFSGGLGADAPTILPTRDFFPEKYDQSDQAVRTLFDRICKYMSVSPNLIDLQFYSEPNRLALVNENGDAIGGAAGTYHKGDSSFVIRIERSQFDRPMTLVGTLAHELAHVRLLGEGRLDHDAFDNELLTDLTVVYHGMGIFLANCPRHWQSHLSTWPDTDALKPEYMTTPMYGYALALRCWLSDKTLPAWRGHLSPGVRSEFKQAFRFLSSQERNHK
jgi:hypothetical protein